MPMPTFPLARLGHFRAELRACFTRRADALFELGDALLCAQAVPSLPHLSLEPAHRRGWGSVYAALGRGEVDAERLRDLLAGCLPDADPPVFAVDVTTWPRCDAECSPERGYYYHPSRHSAGQPIIAGWAYQWICQLSFDRDSWTAPVDAHRLHPLDDTGRTAAAQVRALLGRLPDDGPVPLVVFDAGYDSAQLTLDLAEQRVAVLVRLRSDRCFYADPPPPPPGKTGRPRRHGAKFAFADPATWPAPTATLTCQDDQYGTVTVAAWAGLHPKQQRHPGHGSGGPRPIVRGTIIRVQVQRVPAKTRPPKVLWLWWAGPKGLPLELDLAWRAYIRRFDLEHTVRFAKQTLGWTTPRPRHPEQADRWTWLVLACYAQLRLARGSAAGFRDFWYGWALLRPRRNPPGAPQAGPRAAAAGPPCGIRPSRNQPRRPARRRPRSRRPPDWQRSAPPGRRHGQRPTRHAERVKSQAKRLRQ
jgi:Transposase DDE domain